MGRDRSMMLTFTGHSVDLLNFKPEDVNISDVAHHLALTNRFRGATQIPIPVAQHVVWVSKLVPVPYQRIALHHDDHEAYTGDTVAGLKKSVLYQPLQTLEQFIQSQCCKHFGLEATVPETVHQADLLVRRYEARYLYDPSGVFKPLTAMELELFHDWQPMTWQEAEAAYHKREEELAR